jgi:hypothetical protein
MGVGWGAGARGRGSRRAKGGHKERAALSTPPHPPPPRRRRRRLTRDRVFHEHRGGEQEGQQAQRRHKADLVAGRQRAEHEQVVDRNRKGHRDGQPQALAARGAAGGGGGGGVGGLREREEGGEHGGAGAGGLAAAGGPVACWRACGAARAHSLPEPEGGEGYHREDHLGPGGGGEGRGRGWRLRGRIREGAQQALRSRRRRVCCLSVRSPRRAPAAGRGPRAAQRGVPSKNTKPSGPTGGS